MTVLSCFFFNLADFVMSKKHICEEFLWPHSLSLLLPFQGQRDLPKPAQVSLGERWGAPWTCYQSVTGSHTLFCLKPIYYACFGL